MKQIFIYLMMMILMLILVMIMILLCVAFLTLLERKMLSYIQIRKGPNKLGYMGILQPFSDACKLLSKEMIFIYKSNYIIYYLSPMFMFLMILMMWLLYPFFFNMLSIKLGLIYLFCCLSISSYGLLLSGWSSNSSYSMLGSVRSLSQAISYEVSLAVIFIIPFMMVESFNFMNFYMFQDNIWLIMYMWPLSFLFLFSIMAELNRTPFDFSEGESELVSGFNIEYMSGGFVLIFLSEYASILFLSFMYVYIFLGANYFSFLFYLMIMLMSLLIIWIRGTLPRFRYDLLMYLCWLLILPISLNYMFYMIMFKIFI